MITAWSARLVVAYTLVCLVASPDGSATLCESLLQTAYMCKLSPDRNSHVSKGPFINYTAQKRHFLNNNNVKLNNDTKAHMRHSMTYRQHKIFPVKY